MLADEVPDNTQDAFEPDYMRRNLATKSKTLKTMNYDSEQIYIHMKTDSYWNLVIFQNKCIKLTVITDKNMHTFNLTYALTNVTIKYLWRQFNIQKLMKICDYLYVFQSVKMHKIMPFCHVRLMTV